MGIWEGLFAGRLGGGTVSRLGGFPKFGDNEVLHGQRLKLGPGSAHLCRGLFWLSCPFLCLLLSSLVSVRILLVGELTVQRPGRLCATQLP